MIKIAFCDDDMEVLHQMNELLDRYRVERNEDITYAAFQSPFELLTEIEKGIRPDILFLDVVMPGQNGMDVAKEIRQYDTNMKIIFLTSSPEFAVESYSVGAYFYQLKPICKECDKKIYLPKGRTDRMTIDDFKQYIQFYEDNQALRDQFEENYSFNFGLFGGDLVLDIFHGLFRVNCDKDSLAFQADNLKSFRILEDSRVLFEGNHQELKHYDSKVPEKVKQLEPQIAQFQMQMREYEMFERLERMHEENDKDDNHYHEYHPRPSFDVASPADTFHVELTFDHPYWDNIKWDWTGVSFDSDSPSVEAFLSSYEDKTESLHTLALNLAHLMNPNVKEMTAGEKKQAAKQETGSLEEQKQSSESDTIEQLQKYKGLLDAGVITEEEFTAKKKQLLGI